MIKLLLFVFMLGIGPYILSAQDFSLLHYTVDDGLPGNTVYNIYRDKKGFLWFGTDKGVARYNGIKFEKFTTIDGLSDNEIFSFRQDFEDRIWLGTYNGTLCYYDGTFHSAKNAACLKLPFKVPHTIYILIEQDSSVTFAFFNHNVILNLKHNHLGSFTIQNQKSYLPLRKISDYKYKMVGAGGFFTVDTAGKMIKEKNTDNNDMVSGYNQDMVVFIDSAYILSQDEKIVYRFKKKVNPRTIHNVYSDSAGNTFLCTTRGLYINDTMHILQNNDVSSVTQDASGNYWISTLRNGVYCLEKNFKAKIFSSKYKGIVNYCYADNSGIYFATDDNNLYRLSNGVTKCLVDFKKFSREKPFNASMSGYLMQGDNYYCFYNSGYLIASHIFSDKLVIYSRENAQFNFNPKTLLLSDNHFFIRNSRIVQIENSLSELSSNAALRTTTYTEHPEKPFCMVKAPDEHVWFSTIDHVYRIENKQKIIQRQYEKMVFRYFNFYGKYLLGYTHDNRLLLCYNNQADKAIPFPSEDCVWDKFYQLDSTHILISTDNLYRILTLGQPLGEKNCSLSVVENPFIPLHADNICSDGRYCYFFKDGSIISIAIKDLWTGITAPRLFFNTVKTVRRSFAIDGEVRIPYNDSRNITVSYATLSMGGKNISCQYSISKDGHDSWRDFYGDLNLVNTGFGTYTIKIKAKTISSSYSQPIEFTLTILRPLWATWWFLSLLVCSALTIAAIFIRYRFLQVINKNREQHEAQVKFMKLEYKALNALMNPHFIFNTLHNLQSMFNTNNKIAANDYLWTFANLIRQNMSNVSHELIPLQKEIDLVSNYLALEKLRFEDRLDFSIEVDRELDCSEIMVPPMLVQPLVENSIKHGILPLESKGEIVIHIYERNDFLYIEVRDNGIGLARSLQHQKETDHESVGLDNIKKRMEQLSIIQNRKMSFELKEIKSESGSNTLTVAIIMMQII